MFEDYAIILAAGDGRLDETDETAKSYDRVKAAIEKYERRSRCLLDSLRPGSHIPEWTAVLMLCNLKSPALYMQAASELRIPACSAKEATTTAKKTPMFSTLTLRGHLIIFEAFANDLSSDTMGGRGDTENRKQNLKELLNFSCHW